MPDNRTIQLDLHDHASSGSDGYTNTVASDGVVYSYRYSGGTGNGGDVSFTSRGRVNVTVQLQSGNRYTVADVTFANDIHHQLSWVNQGSQGNAVIQNENSQLQTADYKMTIKDNNVGCTIPCDPQIINR
jgi:hypothetical protein